MRPQQEIQKFKWVPPVKTFPYGPTKIKIIQNIDVYKHHQTHKLNVFFDQANEFVRIMFKNQKASSSQKLNVNYAIGLARCLGLKVNKDTFSEQNMKSREHLAQLKEKLIFNFYKKLNDENKEIFPTPPQGKNLDSDDDNFSESGNSINFNSGAANASKKTEPKEDQHSHFYKYHIGKGNNSIMVRSLFKNRYWWVPHDKNEMDKVNFMWTQIKNKTHMETLLCKYPDKKAGVKQMQSVSTATTALTLTPTSNIKKKVQSSDKVPKLTQQESAARSLENKLYNKVEDNFHMANKKALLLNMKNYYDAIGGNVFDTLPVTFHIKGGIDDPEFTKFKAYYDHEDEVVRVKKQQRKMQRMTSPE